MTHEDDPAENVWFESVAALARSKGIAVATPLDGNADETVRAAAAARPDFLFSFYYRNMLKAPLLACARHGALNMHGSMLPKYRGRAPVNWAIVNGEHETGATLHYMVEKPDAGDIVDQQAVPILGDDTAIDVFRKVTAAAQAVLERSLDALVAGTAPRIVQDASRASYFGRRTPEDGRINWNAPAARIHDLVRGVAPPYPGALTIVAGKPSRVLRTQREPGMRGPHAMPSLYFVGGDAYAQCGDAGVLRVIELDWGGTLLAGKDIAPALGGNPVPLVTISTVLS